MLNQFILGSIQGITEWLPISSEGVLLLVQTRLMGRMSLSQILGQALFLHGGTFLAALIYFRREVLALVKAIFRYRKADLEVKKLLNFLVISTIISGSLGFLLLNFLGQINEQLSLTGRSITFLVGILLLVTGGLQMKAKDMGKREIKDLSFLDSLVLGLGQGLACLPGLSRSGITVSLLLLRSFEKTQALKLSFLMSLPIVLGGNIALNFSKLFVAPSSFWGLVFSFVFGILTIHFLLKLAQKINFGRFVILLGILTLVSALVF